MVVCIDTNRQIASCTTRLAQVDRDSCRWCSKTIDYKSEPCIRCVRWQILATNRPVSYSRDFNDVKLTACNSASSYLTRRSRHLTNSSVSLCDVSCAVGRIVEHGHTVCLDALCLVCVHAVVNRTCPIRRRCTTIPTHTG